MLGHSANWRCALRASPVRKLFKSHCRQKGMKRLASPRPTSPISAGSSRSVEQQIHVFIYLDSKKCWNNLSRLLSCFCVSVEFTVSVVWKRAVDRWRHESKELKISSFCLQDMENKIRSTLNEIYFGKTKDIVNGLRWDMTCWSDRWPFAAGSSRWDLCGHSSFSLSVTFYRCHAPCGCCPSPLSPLLRSVLQINWIFAW